MTIVNRWQRLPSPYQWAAVCGLLLTIIAALVIALVAEVQAGDAGAKAKAVAECTNRNLSSRNDPNQADRAATDALLAAQNNLTVREALDFPLLLAGTPAQRSQAGVDLSTALSVQTRAYSTFQKVRAASNTARAANPIGRC